MSLLSWEVQKYINLSPVTVNFQCLTLIFLNVNNHCMVRDGGGCM